MPPRKAASTMAKAAAAPKKAAAAAKADKGAPTKAAATTTKRKRSADDDEPALKTNGVNGVHDDAKPAKKAKKETTPAPPAKKAAAARAKTPATDADKENSAPAATNDDKTKKRAKSATPAPAAAKAKAPTAAAKRKAETAEAKKAEEQKKDEKAVEAAEAAEETEETEEKEELTAPAKKALKAKKEAVIKKPTEKIGTKINDAPTKPLEIFVFGEGSAGELGLGSVAVNGKKPVDVKRPRLNANLDPTKVGVVQVATGGMHTVVLTKDNKILTWGVNDQGALGRDTSWDGGLRDADADADSDSDSDDDDSGLNPHESTPAEIDTSGVVPGTKFVQVVASDSASFALTEDGRVYGWGTFRASDGILGFSRYVDVQKTPVLLPEPKKVKALATGSNHILALDVKGKLFTWGCPEQNQLGRRCVQRDIKESALRPGGVGIKRGVHIAKIACGSYHSFALDKKGEVYAWGLNNFGQLNVEQGAGDTDATVLNATVVEGLEGHRVADIDGGEHHSVACTDDGKLFTWGRIDGHQLGLAASTFTEDNSIFDEFGKPRILKAPTLVPGVPSTVTAVNAGTDNTFALTSEGKVYSWGFSGNYQTGQGTTDDILVPTLIDNTAVREKKLVFAGAGGQFSIVASLAEN
ncbi:hypothetical protein SBRCBS47491_006444 [Sporothrix bragantina]|uniref:RCC1-like domain-containing protein n=1 Tax=Sporothrix bragantina TaxID=671064 RepID=A0ABP0C5Y4_9PEZI